MLARQGGFSLAEVLVTLAVGSVLLLSASRFLPALQGAVLGQTFTQALEDDLWLQTLTVTKYLQRAGYCRGHCDGQPLTIGREGRCVLVRWDANSNGRWELTPASVAEQTGFRLQNETLETLRGAATCEGKGWEKMTDPDSIRVLTFQVRRELRTGFAPVLTVSISGALTRNSRRSVAVEHSVTGYNL